MDTATLSGSALRGIGHHLCAAAIDALPTTVCLGRNRAKARPSCLRLSAYADALEATPNVVDYYSKAAASVARMYANDRKGCCVISDCFHSLGITSANDPDSGGVILGTDQEVLSQYVEFCGPGDRGCNIPSVLDILRSPRGVTVGGKVYRIDGYVSLDWRSKELTKAAIKEFGNVRVGINLPSAWTQEAIWDVTNTQIVGGHDVPAAGFGDGAHVLGTNSDGVVIASWGRLYLITWPAWTSTRWIEECFVVLMPTWYNGDQTSPLGVKTAQLKADLQKLANGVIPDDPNTPPDPEQVWFV